MKWASNPLRKWPVTPVALISLWDQWAHPFRTVASVAHRIHSWIRLVIPFLLKENWSWSPGIMSSACVETFLPPLLRLFSIARWMLLNTSVQSQGLKTLSPCLAPVSACWRLGQGLAGQFFWSSFLIRQAVRWLWWQRNWVMCHSFSRRLSPACSYGGWEWQPKKGREEENKPMRILGSSWRQYRYFRYPFLKAWRTQEEEN